MGATTSNQQKQRVPINIHEHWQTIDHYSGYTLVKNRMSKRMGEYRQFKLDPKYDADTEIQIYEVRKEAKAPIVRAYLAQLITEGKKKPDIGLCGTNTHMEVITERIPYRLLQLPQLTFEQAYYILQQSLCAFEYLYLKVGPVSISNEMIGINQDGEVKCWINPEWYDNHPKRDSPGLLTSRGVDSKKSYLMIPPQYRDQREIICNIIDIVSQKCEEGALPFQFDYLLRKNTYNFRQAQDFMKKYSQQAGLKIPKFIKKRSPDEKTPHIQEEINQKLKTSHSIHHQPISIPPFEPIPMVKTIESKPRVKPKQILQQASNWQPNSTTKTEVEIPKKVNISFSGSKSSMNLSLPNTYKLQQKPSSGRLELSQKFLSTNNSQSHLQTSIKPYIKSPLSQNYPSTIQIPVSKSNVTGELRRIVKITNEPTTGQICNQKDLSEP